MKIERIKPAPAFEPVVLTLETAEEVMLLAKMYGAMCDSDALEVGGHAIDVGKWSALQQIAGALKYRALPRLNTGVYR